MANTDSNDRIINFSSLSEFIGDNKEMHKTFFTLFINQTNENLKLMEDAISGSDYNVISQLAHKIRPVYGSMGIDKGHQLLVQMEELSKSKSEIQEIQKIFGTFHDLNKQIIGEINEYLCE